MATLLFAAIKDQDLDRLAGLLAAGEDPDGLQDGAPGWRPLHAAIEELEHGGSVEALVLLLRNGAAVDAWDADRDATPLLMALFRGQEEAARMLLAAGADPNVVGGEGDSPLRWCVQQGDLDMAATLLRCGAAETIDAGGGPSGMTALGMAARALDLGAIDLLVAHGADPEAHDTDRQLARARMPERRAETAEAWDAIAARLSGEVER